MNQTYHRKDVPGRPRISRAGICIRDGYTCPVELRDRFMVTCRRMGLKKSEVIRQWIEWFLKENEGQEAKNASQIPP